MPGHTVLVVSTEPVIGALLALYIEMEHYRVVLADTHQPLADAVRSSGATIIVADVDHPVGFSPAFIAEQTRLGRAFIAFGPRILAEELEARAARASVPTLCLPLDVDDARRVLADAARGARVRPGPWGERPKGPDARP